MEQEKASERCSQREEKMTKEEELDMALKRAYADSVRQMRATEDRRLKRLEQEKRKKEELKRTFKEFVETAYDGSPSEVTTIINKMANKDDEVIDDDSEVGNSEKSRNDRTNQSVKSLMKSNRVRALIDCKDAQGNSALSEASAAGNVEVMRLLLDYEANPNSRGAYGRPPVWRAAFGGHMNAVQVLLERGGDPRLFADDGTKAEQVAAIEPIRELLETWDVSHTDRMLEAINAVRKRQVDETAELRRVRSEQVSTKIEAAEKDMAVAQRQFDNCQKTWQQRVKMLDVEHSSKTPDQIELLKTAIADADMELDKARIALEAIRGRLGALRLRRRDLLATEKAAAGQAINEIRVNIRELNDVLVKDIGGKLKSSERWPLVVDRSGQATTFLRYQDTNYFRAIHPHEMQAKLLRLGLLGAIRYGKPMVLDLLDFDGVFESSVRLRFDDISKGLLDQLLDKVTFIKNKSYLKLLRPEEDGDEYKANNFNDARVDSFMFIVVTTNPYPNDSLQKAMSPIVRVMSELDTGAAGLETSEDDSGANALLF